jgi:hypothetical protein
MWWTNKMTSEWPRENCKWVIYKVSGCDWKHWVWFQNQSDMIPRIKPLLSVCHWQTHRFERYYSRIDLLQYLAVQNNFSCKYINSWGIIWESIWCDTSSLESIWYLCQSWYIFNKPSSLGWYYLRIDLLQYLGFRNNFSYRYINSWGIIWELIWCDTLYPLIQYDFYVCLMYIISKLQWTLGWYYTEYDIVSNCNPYWSIQQGLHTKHQTKSNIIRIMQSMSNTVSLYEGTSV